MSPPDPRGQEWLALLQVADRLADLRGSLAAAVEAPDQERAELLRRVVDSIMEAEALATLAANRWTA